MSLIIGSIILLVVLAGYSYLGITQIVPTQYVDYVDKGIIVLIGIVGTWVAMGIVNQLFDRGVSKLMRGNGLARKVFPLLRYITQTIVCLVGLFFTLTLLKINVSALLTGAGVSGIMLAFAGKDYAANLIGSLNLIFSHSFKIGDVIRVKGYEGTVEEITLTLTRLTDKVGATVFMPNKLIVSETIENLSDKRFEILELIIEVSNTQEKQTAEGVLDSIEKEIERLGKKYEILSSLVRIDKITAISVNIFVQVKFEVGTDIAPVRTAIYTAARKTKM